MNVALRRPMTLTEFLRWEEGQPAKYEFDGFQPLAMVGGTAAHSAIQMNLAACLVTRLRDKPCKAHSSDLKISVSGRIRYPDAQVVCTELAPDAKIAHEPTVVFEILSPSSEHTDLVTKNEEYRATPSIQHYVVLEQTHAGALLFSRKGADWVCEPVSGEGAVLRLSAIGIEIPLSEIYEAVPLAGARPESGDATAGADHHPP